MRWVMADHAPDYQGFGDLTVPRRRASMPLIGEALAPWLAGAFVLAVMNLAMLASGDHLPVSEQTVVLLGLCASLAAAGMVAADRKSVVQGKSVSVRVDLGVRRILKKK